MADSADIIIPDRADLLQIAGDLGIAEPSQAYFADTVIELARVLDFSRRYGITYREAWKHSRDALERIQKQLSETELDDLDRKLLDLTMNDRFANELGSILSLAGVRHLIDDQKFFTFDEREVKLEAKRSRDGGAEWVLEYAQQKIPLIVADHPSRTLSGILTLLQDAVGHQIEAITPRLQGRPRNSEREFILDELLQIHRETVGGTATMASGGTFNRMCEAVFDSLGLSTDGLETALARHLKSPRQKR